MVDFCQGPESANKHQLLCARENWALVILSQQEISVLLTQLKGSYPTYQVEGFISNMQGFNSCLILPARSSMVEVGSST